VALLATGLRWRGLAFALTLAFALLATRDRRRRGLLEWQVVA